MKTIRNKTALAYQVLKVLREHFACAEEIKDKLKIEHVDYPGKYFFPVLSYLQLNSFLCYNWISKAGQQIKYFYLTPKGDKYLKRIALN